MNKLDNEIDEMEKAILGTTDSKESTTKNKDSEVKDQNSFEDPAEKALSQEENKAETKTKEESKEKPKAPRNDWKGRYTSLRAHHDALVFELRNEVSYLKDQVVALNKVISQQTKVDTTKAEPVDYAKVLTKEEREVLGEEAVAALSKMTAKATEAAVNPLQTQLETEKQNRMDREVKEAKDNKAQAQNIFLQRLGQLVPDYATIDKDPEFAKWCSGMDQYSGMARKDLFRRAEVTGDVARVAEFFVAYKNSKTTPAKKKDVLEESITPTGEGSAEAANQQSGEDQYFTMAEVNQFYDDVAKGVKYKGKEKLVNQIEAEIEKAALGGRLR